MIELENKTCPVCGSNEMKDETHFLFYCTKYSSIKDEFYKKTVSVAQY